MFETDEEVSKAFDDFYSEANFVRLHLSIFKFSGDLKESKIDQKKWAKKVWRGFTRPEQLNIITNYAVEIRKLSYRAGV